MSGILIGVDLVEIGKIRKTFARFGNRFLKRIFEEKELDFYRNKGGKRFEEGIAALFASKEAVKKIFLQEERKIGWHEVIILHTNSGKPVVHCTPPFNQVFEQISISISHSSSTVVAVAVGQRRIQ